MSNRRCALCNGAADCRVCSECVSKAKQQKCDVCEKDVDSFARAGSMTTWTFCPECYAKALNKRAQNKRARATTLEEEARKILKKE